MITREDVADKLKQYLRHELTCEDLVHWAEETIREEEFDKEHFERIRDVVARLGVADVRVFGLTWEDCEELLAKLGYKARVEVSKAG